MVILQVLKQCISINRYIQVDVTYKVLLTMVIE
jgi:hypothetical protein